MSELINTGPENVLSATNGISDDDTLMSDAATRDAARGEREGLPRGYRMRADKHYVDQLATRAAGQPVRMVSVDDFESTDSFPEVDIEPLIQSIRTNGVVHPLLVRRSASRYAVISGRKRLAAALCLRLPTVPCLVHDIDDAQVSAMAQADNLIVSAATSSEDRSDLVTAVRRAAAQDLATAQAAAEMIAGGTPIVRSVLDLVKAHTWRASRLLDALALISGTRLRTGRDRLVSTIAEQVVDGFAADARLNGFNVRLNLPDAVPSISLDDYEAQAGISGAVLAVLPLVEHVTNPVILIKVAATTSATTVDVTDAAASVPTSLTRRFFDKTARDRPGGWCALAGALAAKAFAEHHGGHATFEAGANGGDGVRMQFPRRSTRSS